MIEIIEVLKKLAKNTPNDDSLGRKMRSLLDNEVFTFYMETYVEKRIAIHKQDFYGAVDARNKQKELLEKLGL